MLVGNIDHLFGERMQFKTIYIPVSDYVSEEILCICSSKGSNFSGSLTSWFIFSILLASSGSLLRVLLMLRTVEIMVGLLALVCIALSSGMVDGGRSIQPLETEDIQVEKKLKLLNNPFVKSIQVVSPCLVPYHHFNWAHALELLSYSLMKPLSFKNTLLFLTLILMVL